MDIFEKQQRLEAIQKIVKVRWLNVAIIVSLGLVLKINSADWAQSFEYTKIGILGVAAFGYNFIYWFFIRRPIEKISNRTLNIIALSQVVLDQIMYAFVFYFTGTVETIAFLLFYLTILVASSLYKTIGIILAGLLAVILHNGILIVEYYGLIPHIKAYQGTIWFGNSEMTRAKIIGFAFYMVVAVAFSVVLSNLIRKRETRLREEIKRSTKQAEQLFVQTKELTKTKDYLHEALEKSDKSRQELTESKKQLEVKLAEVEKYGELTTGREIKMIELKKNIKDLEDKITDLQTQIDNKK
ncbi:MAG: hypothetical protein A2Y98_02055 [Candidatus Portnoybacteria bacterium RBG_19FT_COMBO_36_7]|uniref:Uncharacterized protein n=1 Tax=Candidatus Portnoybacteria bacterium RBG_19FT_COMBO_36_7 TaxID=1801992 RepID=A0A1G2F8K8_9BACT|nr:MAG: hypothetical protein A2Y98_02055 [Candidatus Portnoybacteria bacterium RBG_19FT_COMBO_36_7]